jgi:hypothetical protein
MEYVIGIAGFLFGSLWTAILLFRNGRGAKTSLPPLPVDLDRKLELIADMIGALVQLLEDRRSKR